MKQNKHTVLRQLMIGASVLAMTSAPLVAQAQDAGEDDEIVVTGIRASLKKAMEIKRDSATIVDAITAEDIGKFPDTNLAESLQRVTGVSIDRSLGEGSSVTVRGFGADFNLVTLNGRAMPTSTLGDGASAPSSRSYDFGNIASENIAGVDVYKTSRADVSTGGIGATINIRTTKPLDAASQVATVGVKGVYDTSSIQDEEITPEISGLFSKKFADDKVGIAISGSYQHRKGGVSEYVGYDGAANGGWHPSFVFNSAFDNEWGALPASQNAWNYWNHQYGADPSNRGFADHPDAPDADAVYEIPQKGHYGATEFDRKRINGQLVFQYQPVDNVRFTTDYTYAENKVEAQRNTGGVWFNYNNTISAWTDGPVAGPRFFTDPTVSDLSFEGGFTANKNVNQSLGFNVEWDVTDRLSLEADFHDSSAESKPTNKYGSNVVIGTAVVGITSQTINFENDLPVISIETDPNNDPFDPANRYATGSAFRNAYMRNDLQQLQFKGDYDVGAEFIESVDFGVSYHQNKVRTAFGVLQNNTWGGLGSPADYEDSLFTPISVSELLDGADGANDPNILREIQLFNAGALADDMEARFGICSNPETGTPLGNGTCLAEYTTDRRIQEDTFSGYLQFNNTFELFGRDANLIVGGRYEKTDIESSALVETWNGTAWTGDNEFNLVPSGNADFTTVEASYENFLPNVYFDVRPTEYTKLRAAYSKTMTRPTYDRMQGGLGLAGQFGASRGGGSQGNPALDPYSSKNFDVSGEWYYDDESFISIGYYKKNVKNFIGSGEYQTTVDGLRHPLYGPRADAARAVLGQNATLGEIRNYIIANYPNSLDANGNPTGLPEDELVQFTIGIPATSDRTLGMDGWEFAIQHMFGDSGFGAIVNYTIANGDFEFDNTLVGLPGARANQFALPGLSDSANIIAFYDKNGLQARVAWNWRDAFLASAGGTDPWYTEEYSQIDANVSYEIREGLTLFVEGIDITGTDRRGHHRHPNTATFYNAQQPRYAVGARYKF